MIADRSAWSMGHRQERGNSRPSPTPPPTGKTQKSFCYMGGLFATFFPYRGLWAFLLRLSPYCFFSPCEGPFQHVHGYFLAIFFLHVGGLFCLYEGAFYWACPPPTHPYKNFCGRPWCGV